jgi:hypothetical protein
MRLLQPVAGLVVAFASEQIDQARFVQLVEDAVAAARD